MQIREVKDFDVLLNCCLETTVYVWILVSNTYFRSWSSQMGVSGSGRTGVAHHSSTCSLNNSNNNNNSSSNNNSLPRLVRICVVGAPKVGKTG